jgi:branched-chain amino acid transport system substrate-binding protein
MRKLGLATSLCVALIFAITSVSSSRAQISDDTIKIGVMADMNGPLSTAGGRGSVEAARMAAEEFGGLIAGKHIEIVSADHQNKPDIGAAIARQWFNVEHVDVTTDLANSAVGFAVVEIAKPLNKIVLGLGTWVIGFYWQGLRAHQHPLDMGHLRRGHYHRTGHRRPRRQHLVLHRFGLCVRARA